MGKLFHIFWNHQYVMYNLEGSKMAQKQQPTHSGLNWLCVCVLNFYLIFMFLGFVLK